MGYAPPPLHPPHVHIGKERPLSPDYRDSFGRGPELRGLALGRYTLAVLAEEEREARRPEYTLAAELTAPQGWTPEDEIGYREYVAAFYAGQIVPGLPPTEQRLGWLPFETGFP